MAAHLIGLKSKAAKTLAWSDPNPNWSEAPGPRDAAPLETFLTEYPHARKGVVVCRTPKPFKLGGKVTAAPWQELPALVERLG